MVVIAPGLIQISERKYPVRVQIQTPEKCALTPREIEVLRLVADGLTTKAIASKLNISFKTAACHRFRILQKLGIDSTVLAVRWAIREGIVRL